MKKALKWAGIVLGALVGIIVVAVVVLLIRGGARLNRSYDVQPEALTVPTDTAAVSRGRHIVEAISLCEGCHGENLSGKAIIDDPSIATVYASNLTPGKGGIGGRYTDSDYVRAIRHGVNASGRGMMIMHSDHFHRFSREDLGAVIAYLKTIPAVDHEVPPIRTAAMGKILIALGMFDTDTMPLVPAEVIDHNAPFAGAPDPGVTVAYGRYLATIALCTICHQPNLQGGPPIEEGAPPAPSIVPYGSPAGWSEEQFISTIRTGQTPYGRSLNPEGMPWEFFRKMTDDELRAIRMYIASVAAE